MFGDNDAMIINKLKNILAKITSVGSNIDIVKNNIFASDDTHTYNAAEWAKLANTNICNVHQQTDTIITKLNNSSIDNLFQTTSICNANVRGEKVILFSGSITVPNNGNSYAEVAVFNAPQTGTYYFQRVQSGSAYYQGYRVTCNNIVVKEYSQRYVSGTHYFVLQLNKDDVVKIETYAANSSSSSTANATCTELSYQIINNVHKFATDDKNEHGYVDTFVAQETGYIFVGVRASNYLYLYYNEGGVGYRLNKCTADEDYFGKYELQEYTIPVYKGCEYKIGFYNSDSHHNHKYDFYIRASNHIDVVSPKIIKSVQRGTTSTSEGSVTIVFGQVDISKCLVLLDQGIYTSLTDTSVTIEVPITYSSSGDARSTTCAWQVIEFW